MLTTIYKYVLGDDSIVQMPKGAHPISVALQPVPDKGDRPKYENICLWAIVDPAQPPVDRQVRIYGTGHVVDTAAADYDFVGTVSMFGGSLVFHVFVGHEGVV